jgi:hypothetical protein
MDLNQLLKMGMDPQLVRILAQAQQAQSPPPAEPEQPAMVETAAGQPAAVVDAPINRIADLPDFAPEEKESLMRSVGRKTLSGLNWVGESLDKPGRAVRGVLGGEFNEIFDIIPFSDTLGLTTPTDDVSGRDLLEKYGVLGENAPGLDLGDVAGFAVEVATDPFSWMSFGGSKAASQVLKSGGKAEKALTAASKGDEIAAGTRNLVDFHTPTFGIPLPQKIPFTDVKIPRLEVPFKELGGYGTGAGAAKVYEAVHYGKYSPNPYIRKWFSSVDEVGNSPVRMQKDADRRFERRMAAEEFVDEKGPGLLMQKFDTEGKFANLRQKAFGGVNENKMMADAVKVAWDRSDAIKDIVKAKAGDVKWDALNDPKQIDALAEVYQEITTKKEAFKDFADDVLAKHQEHYSIAMEQLNNPDAAHARFFDDTIRSFVEAEGDFSVTAIADRLRSGGLKDGVEGFDEATQAMHSLVDELRKIPETALPEMRELGIDVGDANGYDFRYSHRRPTMKPGSALANYYSRRAIKTAGSPLQVARDKIMRMLPTTVINRMTRDEKYTSVARRRKQAEALWAEKVGNVHAPDLTRAPAEGTYMRSVFDMATQEGVPPAGVMSFAQQVRVEEEAAYRAAVAYKKDILALADNIIGGQWRKKLNDIRKADTDTDELPGLDLLSDAILTRTGELWDSSKITDFLATWNQKAYPKKDNDTIAREAIQRFRAAEKENEALRAAGAADDELSFDTDLFDATKDKTAYPDPAFNDGRLKPTRDNRAFLLVKEYDLPAWYNRDKNVRAALRNSADPALRAFANADQNDFAFKTQFMDYLKDQQAGLPDEARWADGIDDVDDFMLAAKQNHPELKPLPEWSQDQLLQLVDRLAYMPEEVLKEGLFNRGTVTDSIDYLMQVTRLKAGVASLRQMLKAPEVLREDGIGVPLAELWGKPATKHGKGLGLTKEGLASFVREIGGADMTDDAVAAFIAKKTVDPEIADMAIRFIEPFVEPEKIAGLLKGIDSFNSLFKGTLTIPYPAFHTRNRLGGLFQNWAAGIHDPEGEQFAQDLFLGKIEPEEAEKWLAEIKTHRVSSVIGGESAGQVYDKMDRFAPVGTTQLPMPGEGGAAKEIARYITNPFGELVNDVKFAYQKGGVKGAAQQFFMGGKNAAGDTATDMNIFGAQGGFDPLGARNRRGDVDAFGQPKKGIDLYTAPTTTNAWYKAGGNANNYIEWMNRVGPYVALRKAGWSPAMAARKVRQVQYDYREMSALERKVFKRVIPFYSFARKNIEQQVRLLLQNPGGRTAQTIRAEHIASTEGQNKGSYVPKYLAESFAVRLPGGTDEQATFFAQSGLLPHEEAFNRFVFDDQGFPLNMTRSAEKLLAQANPLIQMPAEAIAGKQFWSGRRLDDLYQSPTPDQDVNLLISKSPLSRVIGTAAGLADDRKSIPMRAFNFLVGGAKFTDVNVEKQRKLELRDILENELGKDQDIAQYTGLYAADIKGLIDRYNAGDQEAAKQLKLYMDLKAELKEIKKAESQGASAEAGKQ